MKVFKGENINKKTNSQKNIKAKLFASLALFSIAMFMVISGIIISVNEQKTRFTSNVYINGNNVRGYTAEMAKKEISNKLKNNLDNVKITLKYDDKEWTFDESDFEIDESVQKVVSNAFKTSKLNVKDAINMASSKYKNYNFNVLDIFKNFDLKIDNIISQIDKEAVDASVEFNPDQEKMFNVCKEHEGIKVDKEQLIKLLNEKIFKNKDICIDIPTIDLEPKITSEYFADKLNLQSKFSTSIKNSQAGRRNNVAVALKKVNGTVVKPNEIVSFNSLTSPQDATGGYQNAIIILNGVYTNGMGGGICQASTTLYNALVLANLEIEEVHKHTIPVHYVEHALDAMISDGYADLIFKNTSNDDVYIKSYVKGDDAVVEIYGKTLPDGVTIKRVAEETTISHPGDKVVEDVNGEYSNKVLYKGEYYRLKWPSEGYDAKAYKEYCKEGKLIKREEIRHEKYQPQQGIVIEGAKDLPEGFVLPEQDVTIYPPQDEQNN